MNFWTFAVCIIIVSSMCEGETAQPVLEGDLPVVEVNAQERSEPFDEKANNEANLSVMESDVLNERFDAYQEQQAGLQTVSTLVSALVSAYDYNPDLQSKRRDTLSSFKDVVKARAGFLPTLEASTSFSGSMNQPRSDYAIQRTDKTTTHGGSGQLTLRQNLFAGGSTYAAVMSADAQIRGQWATLLSSEQKTFSDVIKNYLDLVMKLAKVTVRQAYKAAMQKNYDTSFEKHKIGEETITQVANAEAKLMEADATLRSAEADVVTAKANFIALIGAAPGQLSVPLEPKGLPKTVAQAIDVALKNHPDLIAAQYNHQAAKANIDQANGALYSPTVDVEASISKGFQNQRIQSDRDVFGSSDYKQWTAPVNQQVGITMRYPLYAGGQYSANKRAAHDTALAKRFAIENVKAQLKSSVQGTFQSIVTAKQNIENYKNQVKAAEIAVSATRQEMEVGTKVLKDVLDAEYNLVQAQISLVEAENTFYTSVYQMVSLLGGLHAKAMQLPVVYFDPEKFYGNGKYFFEN